MVIGQGLLAKRFSNYRDNDDIIIFASGVSNSGNTTQSEFDREETLLRNSIQNYTDKTFVYFGTCSVYDSSFTQSAYVRHKLAMENIVRLHTGSYHIFRISNLAGKTGNPHTVLNYFVSHILNEDPFHLWANSSRNIIDIDDAYRICDFIIRGNLFSSQIINVANPVNYPVHEIVSTLELHLQKKGTYTTLPRESNPAIDVSAIKAIIAKLNINFDAGYLQRTIEKYFPVK